MLQRGNTRGALSLVLMLLIGTACGAQATKKPFILVAHRGGVVDENTSENSMRALDEAVKRGYTHVEVDVRVTKDGHTVCFHDDNLKRETGVDKNIPELTLAELKAIPLTRSKQTIPTFDEYCARCQGRINVMIDTKGVEDDFVEQYNRELETSLTRYGLLKDALFITNRPPKYNQDKVVKHFLGKAKVALRLSLPDAQALEKSLGQKLSTLYFVFNSPRDLTPEDIEGFHQMGLLVIPTINVDHYKTGEPMKEGPAAVATMLRCGVDGLQIDSCYDPPVFEYLRK